MKREWSQEDMERMIAGLEQEGLLEAPPSLEQNVMRMIAHMDGEKVEQEKYSPRTRKLFYQLKICAAMAASLVLVVSSGQLKKQEGYLFAESHKPNGWVERIAERTDSWGDRIGEFSGFIMKQIMEVTEYEK